MKKYLVKESELLDLLESYCRLAALDNGGVDNWEWCGESNCDYLGEAYRELGIESDDQSFKELAHFYLKDYKVVED